MKQQPKTDHGFPEIKVLLRQKLVRSIDPGNALDLYAGEGRMLASVAPHFLRTDAVEFDPLKFMKLARTIEKHDIRNVRLHCMDNTRFIRDRAAGLTGVNYIDLDAYGCPNRLVLELFRNWSPGTRTAFAVTDGGKIHLSRGNRMDPADYFPGAEEETPEAHQDGAGNLGSKSVRLRPEIIRDYELLVKSFWKHLGKKHGFRVVEYLSAWKKSRRVIYYGVCIEPD